MSGGSIVFPFGWRNPFGVHVTVLFTQQQEVNLRLSRLFKIGCLCRLVLRRQFLKQERFKIHREQCILTNIIRYLSAFFCKFILYTTDKYFNAVHLIFQRDNSSRKDTHFWDVKNGYLKK